MLSVGSRCCPPPPSPSPTFDRRTLVSFTAESCCLGCSTTRLPHFTSSSSRAVCLCHCVTTHADTHCTVWFEEKSFLQFLIICKCFSFFLSSKMTHLALNLTVFDHIPELNVGEYCCCCAITRFPTGTAQTFTSPFNTHFVSSCSTHPPYTTLAAH